MSVAVAPTPATGHFLDYCWRCEEKGVRLFIDPMEYRLEDRIGVCLECGMARTIVQHTYRTAGTNLIVNKKAG